MKFMLKTLGISIVLAIAGCTSTNTTTSPSLSAADDAPACASSCSAACKAACNAKTKAKCGSDCTKPCCADKNKASSLGAFNDDAAKSSCCPGAKSKADKTGECPFSGKNKQ